MVNLLKIWSWLRQWLFKRGSVNNEVIEAGRDEDSVDEFTYQFSDDPPEQIEYNTVYIIGEYGFYWQLLFICPCGCNDGIQLNLLSNSFPSWEYHITSKDKISIYPSIWKTKGCKSHFILRNSKIRWVNDISHKLNNGSNNVG